MQPYSRYELFFVLWNASLFAYRHMNHNPTPYLSESLLFVLWDLQIRWNRDFQMLRIKKMVVDDIVCSLFFCASDVQHSVANFGPKAAWWLLSQSPVRLLGDNRRIQHVRGWRLGLVPMRWRRRWCCTASVTAILVSSWFCRILFSVPLALGPKPSSYGHTVLSSGREAYDLL